MTGYTVQAAKEAQAMGYGGESYWQYLEAHGRELHAYYAEGGDPDTAEAMVSRSLSEALRGNDGE